MTVGLENAIEIIGCHAEGEVGDVIIGGVEPPPGDTIWEQARWIANDQTLRNFVLNEPRGGVFRHVNLLVPAKDPFRRGIENNCIGAQESPPPKHWVLIRRSCSYVEGTLQSYYFKIGKYIAAQAIITRVSAIHANIGTRQVDVIGKAGFRLTMAFDTTLRIDSGCTTGCW